MPTSEQINILTQLIGNLGFPIIVAGYLMFRLDRQINKLVDHTEQLATTETQLKAIEENIETKMNKVVQQNDHIIAQNDQILIAVRRIP